MADLIPSANRSALVMALMQNAQRNQGRPSYSLAGSLDIASQPIMAALLARKERGAQDEQSRVQQARQQALAGALSRAGQGGPQGEAAKRAALIISGGLPEDPMAKALLGAQAESIFAPKGRTNPFGVINPSDFTPESMQKYSETNQWSDLVPRENKYGRYTPSQYTAESWAKFTETENPGVLELRPEFRFQQTPSGAVVAGNTLTGGVTPTSVTPEAATAEAAERKRAEAEAAATGEAVGKAQGMILQRAMNAEGIDDILDIAEPLIDEATGSGTGAGRDKLAAFFGVSTTGAQAIAQLLPLQAAIMLRQPRMEGPQSDRDVQLYREAAGQLGDPSVPNATKKAAVQTIRRLQQVYKNDPTGSRGASSMPDVTTMSDEELRRLAGGQ